MKSPFGTTLPPGVRQADIDGPEQPEPPDFEKWSEQADTDQVRKVLDLWWDNNRWEVSAFLGVAHKFSPANRARIFVAWGERLEAIFEALWEKGALTR